MKVGGGAAPKFTSEGGSESSICMLSWSVVVRLYATGNGPSFCNGRVVSMMTGLGSVGAGRPSGMLKVSGCGLVGVAGWEERMISYF